MDSSRNSLLSRVAVSSMDLAVRFWPESSREWGQAVLAEMGQISEPVAALNWAAGGMLLFGRAVMAHFFEWIKLPAGAGFSGASPANSNGPQFPKHSRLATALVLLAAMALFLLPIGREAARTVRSSWSGFLPSGSDERELDRLAAKAGQEKDARGLAFVAAIYPDRKKAYDYADQAVELDPSLAWIYGNRWGFTGQDSAQTGKRAERLQEQDPENGFVYLANAHAIGEPLIEKQILEKHGVSAGTARDILAGNAAWKTEMEKGFAAKKYDDYSERNLELVQEGWRKNPSLSPALMGISVWEHSSMGSAVQLLIYADMRSKEAVQVGTAGSVKPAEDMLSELRDFGRRMSLEATSPFEKRLGMGVTQRGLVGFEKLYAATGQATEEKSIRTQLGELETAKNTENDSYLSWRGGVERNFRWKALTVQIAALLCLVLAIAVVVSLAALEVGSAFGWRMGKVSQRLACRVADYGPVLFLLTSVGLVISFWPLAEAFERFRSAEQPGYEGFGLFWQMLILSDANVFDYFYDPYHRWLVGTVALVAIAAIVLVRGLMRGKTVTAAR